MEKQKASIKIISIDKLNYNGWSLQKPS